MTDMKAQAAVLSIKKLKPFEGHPFHVKDDTEMERLVYSIITQGLLTPISVRPIENNEYEVISGHRRLHACKKAGIETVPALIYALDRDEATEPGRRTGYRPHFRYAPGTQGKSV